VNRHRALFKGLGDRLLRVAERGAEAEVLPDRPRDVLEVPLALPVAEEVAVGGRGENGGLEGELGKAPG
jgi:hypothetical protein